MTKKIKVPSSISKETVDQAIRGLENCAYTDEELGAAIAVANIFEYFLSKNTLCSCTLSHFRREIEILNTFKSNRERK